MKCKSCCDMDVLAAYWSSEPDTAGVLRGSLHSVGAQ